MGTDEEIVEKKGKKGKGKKIMETIGSKAKARKKKNTNSYVEISSNQEPFSYKGAIEIKGKKKMPKGVVDDKEKKENHKYFKQPDIYSNGVPIILDATLEEDQIITRQHG